MTEHSKDHPSKDGAYLQQKVRLSEFLSSTDGRNGWWVGSAPIQRRAIFGEMGVSPGTEPSRFVMYPRPILLFDLLEEWKHKHLDLFGSEMSDGLNLIYICHRPKTPTQEMHKTSERQAAAQKQYLLLYLNSHPLTNHRKWIMGMTDNPEKEQELWAVIRNKSLPWVLRNFPDTESANGALKKMKDQNPMAKILKNNKIGSKIVFAFQRSKG